MVLKVPDSSFSRGVKKVDNLVELAGLAREWLKETDLLLAQAFMPTSFDWRVGVLGGKPLFVCQYMMAPKHWQIVKHRTNGKALEGAHKTISLGEAPPQVIDIGLRAASLIGDGLYGVDIKQTERGPVVIEINDNPNLEVGIEDAVLKDELYRRVLGDLVRRIELRRRQASAAGERRNGAPDHAPEAPAQERPALSAVGAGGKSG
jgi:glutathione synthase/RimK-type ligase-like ATP-grasp enzyme